ncbi:Choline transporter ctl1 [Lecanosticta acicola]|uniref:Protein PNS1 n=1 Tax=Lecanosticta acicola TaxID=111012 RepID=A0AAI8YTH5_9PEZI|nr:Choline transporter ctl1 [Lecanosticta acicola]
MPSHPYHNPASSQSRFPFATRLSRQDPHAPLFYSATDDFQDNDEGNEHEREVADYYALQRSRQQFGPSNLTESSEIEDDGVEKLEETQKGQNHDRDESRQRGRIGAPYPPSSRADSMPASEASRPSSKGKGRLVDVNLNSTIHEEPPASLANISPSIDPDEPPVPYRPFKSGTKNSRLSSFMPMETDDEAQMMNPRPPSPDRESVPPTVILPAQEPPKHDTFWGNIFIISLCTMFATFVVIWFQTSSPSKKTPLGDTVYSALRGSTNMLVWDTLIAVVVALIWLSLLRHYVRVLVFGMLVAVPVILTIFSLYPLISSFHGSWNGNSIQDKAMRWLSLVPAVAAVVWTWNVIQSRHSLHKSIRVLEFSTRILTASPYLVFLGFATLGVVVAFSWIWMLMFERVFLSGHWVGAKKFILYANSWWLGAFFILQFLWTLTVIAGIQRATTAATVSQWYFHRLAVPQPTSREVVRASYLHATGALFGTVSLSTFLSLLVRLPLIILPGRLSGLLNMCAYWIIPTSLASLTNPLTLTYAAIHSQPLGIAARGLGQLNFVSRSNPSNTLGPRNFNPAGGTGSALIPYRLSKLLLQATRWVMSAALGFGGWVRAAHQIQFEGAGAGIKGSLYAYVVGMIAGTIGFAVLGAVENVVGAVVDAAVICWASESAGGRGEAKFCREAGELFGNDGGFERVGMA